MSSAWTLSFLTLHNWFVALGPDVVAAGPPHARRVPDILDLDLLDRGQAERRLRPVVSLDHRVHHDSNKKQRLFFVSFELVLKLSDQPRDLTLVF